MPNRADDSASQLLIVGASARAAAFSARRAAFNVSTIDLFADQDLCQVARASLRANRYPRGILRLANGLPPGPWLYTGGLENHPRLIDRLARLRPLYGNPAPVLRRVRDPFCLQRCLADAGFAFPPTVRAAERLPRDGSWLAKGFGTSGGHQVEPWLGQPRPSAGKYYFQRRLDGHACAAVYLAAGGDAVLLGVTGQLVGAAWCGARAFHYCGSIGPLALNAPLRERFSALGRHLSQEFSLAGLFGVDVVLTRETMVCGRDRAGGPQRRDTVDRSGMCLNQDAASTRIWAIEVNPRYPASAEVLERALGVSLVGLHVQACRAATGGERGKPPAHRLHSSSSDASADWAGASLIGSEAPRGSRLAGKAILYAQRDLVVAAKFVHRLAAANRGLADPWSPAIADLPTAGSRIRAGWPVLTLLEDGRDANEVEDRLRQRAAEIQAAMAAL
jgi:predicted ATP-grasp superfamily ATP-dependent carboligase